MSKRSILAETLAEIQDIRNQVEENANFALKSTLKEDLEEVIRKGLNEADEYQPDEMAGDEVPADQTSDALDSDGMTDEPAASDIPGEESPMDGDSEPEVIDLTDMTDDEVISQFNLMQPADEIEIVKTETGIAININNPEAAADGAVGVDGVPGIEGEPGDAAPNVDSIDVALASDEPSAEDPTATDDEDDKIMETAANEETTPVAEETVAEEAPVAETTVQEEAPVEEDHIKSKAHMRNQLDELQEGLVNTRRKVSDLLAENQAKAKELENVNSLVNEFKQAESEYKQAISNLKRQLHEVALFTSNLTYATKLMTENTTSKDEKYDILKKFDKATTLAESKAIFESLNESFTAVKKTATQTIEEKVLQASKTSGASSLNESTAYVNPQMKRMLDIINKIK